MNKNKELSRLLGIEPKSQCELSPVDEYCELECPCVECELDKPNIYPDFTKPDNFVKLLNLVYKCGINQKCDFQLASLSFEYDDNSIWIDEVEEIKISFENVWIECLKTKLQTNNPDSWDINFANIIKQQAQQTNWTY